MLKNCYDFKCKREYQNGIVEVHDKKIWTYGYHLKPDEKKFLVEKYKLPKDILENINQ